jgi:hypothetical protein
MSEVAPVKVGLLADYVEGEDQIDATVLRALQLTFDEFVDSGAVERPIELVVRAVQGSRGCPTAASVRCATRSSSWSTRTAW